jgi:hypothetical protein
MKRAFEPAGQIEWAILAPANAEALREIVVELWSKQLGFDIDEDEPQSWCVVPGTKKHSAVIETEPGSSSTEVDLAAALSKRFRATVYAIGFSGYDDPDRGLPHMSRFDDGKEGLIWMAKSYDDELGEPETVPWPVGIPEGSDPFEFAKALGCELLPYYERRR